MILSVDDSMADYHLSRICEFAKIMNVSDDKLLDIAAVIKYIYNDNDNKGEFEFKSSSVKKVFKDLVNLFRPEA